MYLIERTNTASVLPDLKGFGGKKKEKKKKKAKLISIPVLSSTNPQNRVKIIDVCKSLAKHKHKLTSNINSDPHPNLSAKPTSTSYQLLTLDKLLNVFTFQFPL